MLMWLTGGLMVAGLVIMIGSIVDLGIEIFKHKRWEWDCVVVFVIATIAFVVGAYLFDYCRDWIY